MKETLSVSDDVKTLIKKEKNEIFLIEDEIKFFNMNIMEIKVIKF